MSKSEVDAENIHPKEKIEYQDVEQELYIAPFEIYDSSENNDDIEDLLYFEDNEIKQTSETSFSIGVSASKEISAKKNKNSSFLEKTHTVLDVAGFIPGLGAIPDVANGLIYLCEGDFANMGISFLPDYVTDNAVKEGKIVRLEVEDFKVVVWKQILHHRDKWVSAQMEALLKHLSQIILGGKK